MKTLFEYAVKVVIGKGKGHVVAPGEYWTAINVHNPNLNMRSIKFYKRVAIGLPSEKAGPVSRWFKATLKAGQALEIDRDDIFQHADADGFLKGFVVIRCNVELDVVAVYTVSDTRRRIASIHTERVPPRALHVKRKVFSKFEK